MCVLIVASSHVIPKSFKYIRTTTKKTPGFAGAVLLPVSETSCCKAPLCLARGLAADTATQELFLGRGTQTAH